MLGNMWLGGIAHYPLLWQKDKGDVVSISEALRCSLSV